MTRRIAIAAGGTAGHVHPALAVADAYRARDPDVEIIFLGTTDGIETRLVPHRGYPLRAIPGAPLFGVGVAGKARALAALIRGVAAARALLRSAQTELVVGFGGYAGAGAIVAARSLGLATAIHEANAVPGIANRLLGRFADRVLLGFPAAAAGFQSQKTLVTGLPVDDAIAAAARARIARTDPNTFRVLISGGSGGSAFLNTHVPELLARVAQADVRLAIHHQSGTRDLATVREAYRDARLEATVSAYIENMAAAYQASDFAITCAGAGTLAELAALGMPALLTPLGTAALDHQRANASAYAAMTGSRWTAEDVWNIDEIAAHLIGLAQSPAALADAAAWVRTAARTDAARIVVEALEALLQR